MADFRRNEEEIMMSEIANIFQKLIDSTPECLGGMIILKFRHKGLDIDDSQSTIEIVANALKTPRDVRDLLYKSIEECIKYEKEEIEKFPPASFQD